MMLESMTPLPKLESGWPTVYGLFVGVVALMTTCIVAGPNRVSFIYRNSGVNI
jgi:hypothetical protein